MVSEIATNVNSLLLFYKNYISTRACCSRPCRAFTGLVKPPSGVCSMSCQEKGGMKVHMRILRVERQEMTGGCGAISRSDFARHDRKNTRHYVVFCSHGSLTMCAPVLEDCRDTFLSLQRQYFELRACCPIQGNQTCNALLQQNKWPWIMSNMSNLFDVQWGTTYTSQRWCSQPFPHIKQCEVHSHITDMTICT